MTQASFVDAGNWFCLMLCDVINYNDVISATDSNIRVRKGCTFHWCMHCGKYCCL